MAIDKSKYIMLDGVMPIIFSAGIPHDAFRAIEGKITSAGFIKLYSDNGAVDVACFGESVSLNLKAHPDDAEIIRTVMGL